jgi:hypothetical protein
MGFSFGFDPAMPPSCIRAKPHRRVSGSGAWIVGREHAGIGSRLFHPSKIASINPPGRNEPQRLGANASFVGSGMACVSMAICA